MLQHVVLRIHDGRHVQQYRVGRTVQLRQLQRLDQSEVSIVVTLHQSEVNIATRPAGLLMLHSSALSAAAPGPITNHVKVLSSHSGISHRNDHRIQYLFYLHLVEDLAPLCELGAVAPGLEVLGQRHLDR